MGAVRFGGAAVKLKAVDLFSGCGGLTLGLKQAGFEVRAALDVDPLAVETYKKNHPTTAVISDDIRSVTGRKLLRSARLRKGELDLVAGCPPCQGFSSLRTLNGGVKINEPMNDLVFEFVRIVEEALPRAVMLENVPGLFDDARLKQVTTRLEALGFRCKADVFDAVEFGVPQRRRRMILIGTRDFEPQFGRRARSRRTVKTAIYGLPKPGSGTDPLHDYEVNRAPHVDALIKKIPLNGGSRSDLPKSEQLQCHLDCDGFYDVYGRMSWSLPAPTVTGGCINPSKGRFLHPKQHRAITLREAALLQGFPKKYYFSMERGRYPAAQMIGNAFPPGLARSHAAALRQVLTRSCKRRGRS
ncbi:MAG TPA: DNA cytosine methyltransferase [Vitreimonas sp.]|uniref:DNA cytosine methyltransferase n=1 Tax=Vitreimonas sp. TaxID=3069702 RepID=UPI002D51C560|nr:DNA cytosine methyltransferase [Vitreimonas sp.]HYD86243.1 DNA cytosine methyltransferase [Vitreimonas sp.]